MNRFSRTEMLFGSDAMGRLRNAHVAVVGLGGVGSYAVEALARAGIGHLRLVDFDNVKESNINRQLYALGSTVGRKKIEIARERVMEINPDCAVETLPVFADNDTAAAILQKPLDVVVDAIDSVGPKVRFLAASVASGVFVISSMGAATRSDPAAVRVADISETRICPLARYIRTRLRTRGVTGGIRCVYSVEPVTEAGGELPEEPVDQTVERGRARKPLGSFSCLPGIFGLTAAREAIIHITGYKLMPHKMGLKTGRNLDNIQELLAQVEGEDSR
jgi:tRNA A37 threonylcarbamoyladenosine dehydratase